MNPLSLLTRWTGPVAITVAAVALYRAETRPVVPPAPVVTREVAPRVEPAPAPRVEARAEPTHAAPPVEPAPEPVAAPRPAARAAHAGAAPAPRARAHAAAAVGAPSALRVARVVVARGVRDRAPVEPGSTFTLADASRLYAYVEVANDGAEAGEIVVSFEREDGDARVGLVRLEVPSAPRYRTWGYTRMIREAGTWHAVVRDAAGNELARARFDVTA